MAPEVPRPEALSQEHQVVVLEELAPLSSNGLELGGALGARTGALVAPSCTHEVKLSFGSFSPNSSSFIQILSMGFYYGGSRDILTPIPPINSRITSLNHQIFTNTLTFIIFILILKFHLQSCLIS